MKKLLIVPVIALGFVACKTKTATPVSGDKVATSPKYTAKEPLTAEMLAQGKTVFENSCVKCHALPNPAKYSDTKWVALMNAMAPKAKLSDKQAELVYNYVTSKN